ncbi:MAG TPA: hypothetical protein DDW27_17445 [Bacteroidales bacterium]|nr:hypothetical protein [Bacteroidales bacterium]
MFIKLLIISAIFLILALAGLAVSILLKSSGRFPETHVGHNKEMRKLGIGCARKTDIGCQATGKPENCEICGTGNI